MILPFLPFPLLYAETHFKFFKGIWSRFFKKEPEIIIDSVWRIEPGQTIPLLLLIKDAHIFPVILEKISLTMRGKNNSARINFEYDQPIADKLWWRVEYIDPVDFAPGQNIQLNAVVHYRDFKNRKKSCVNDNYYPHTPPLNIYLSDKSLLKGNNWLLGDLHLHSFYTNDQIEFAAPLPVTASMAKAMGLDFIGITDHSYDLDDSEGSYLQNDPALPKWKSFLSEVDNHNRLKENPLIIPGFEVTVENSAGKSIHLQVFNSRELFKGSSDSGEKWIHSKPEWRLNDIIPRLSPKSIACAAHIGEKTPLLQQLLLGRGSFSHEDLQNKDLRFFQLANGRDFANLRAGIELWTTQLLSGKKVIPLAGSDSHGNFNFSRSVILPHLAMKISKKQLLGEVRTAVWAEKGIKTIDGYVEALENGRIQITSGPIIDLYRPGDDKSLIGTVINNHESTFRLTVISSDEAGKLSEIKVLFGLRGKNEETFKTYTPNTLNFITEINLDNGRRDILYFRVEAFTERSEFSISAPLYWENSV